MITLLSKRLSLITKSNVTDLISFEIVGLVVNLLTIIQNHTVIHQ